MTHCHSNHLRHFEQLIIYYMPSATCLWVTAIGAISLYRCCVITPLTGVLKRNETCNPAQKA